MTAAYSNSKPFRRIRFVFAVLAGLVLFTTILIASAQVRDNYSSLIETEERSARNLVRSGESHATQIIKETQRILEGIGLLYLDRQRTGEFDESIFHAALKRTVDDADYIYSAYLADQDGFALAAGNTFPLDTLSKTYSFNDIFDIKDDGENFYLGSFTRASQRSGETIGGKWFIPALLKLSDEAGTMRGYVIGLIDPVVFEEFYDQMEVGQHGRVNLWDAQGTMVAGNENSPWAMGEVLERMAGWVREVEARDEVGDLRIYTVEQNGVPLVSTRLSVDNLNFGLAVTLDGRDFLAPWHQARLQIILEAAVFLLVLGGLAVVLWRQLGQLEAGERRIRDAKKEAERANKVKVQFLAQVSHEFRTPLNAIIGFSQAIRDRVLGAEFDQKYTEYADDIYGSGRHLLELVNDIIDFSKIEAGEYKVVPGKVSANAVVENVITMMSVQGQSREITISPTFAEPDIWLNTDQRLLKQVLINLMANAIKFSHSGSSVRVEISRTGGNGVEVKVSDKGRGMSDSILSRIGEPFLVESSQTNNEGQGSGLGLSIAKMCMDLMGGQLSIRSKEGEGTQASIIFSKDILLRAAAQEW